MFIGYSQFYTEMAISSIVSGKSFSMSLSSLGGSSV
jgi:hypothetical protein